MDLTEFKKIEKKVKKPDFSEDYKGLNILLRVLSLLGNLASIFLASFFVTGLLSVAIETPIIYWVVAIVALTGLELTKREIFYRFSRDFIRTKKIFTSAVAPMLFFTMCLISLSFYSSLSGAQKFSSKSDQIEVVAETQIDNFTDSTKAYYQEKIEILEKQNRDLFETNQKIDDQVERMLEEHPTWSNTARKLREPQKENTLAIEKNDWKIKELKTERNETVGDYKKDIETESSEDKEKNQSDSYIFIAISTLIEFLILIGIYFNNIFNFRSYRDAKKRLQNDDNFRSYHEFAEIIEVLFLNRTEKDKVPSKDLMMRLLHLSKVYLRDDQLDDALELFEALKITETNGDINYLLKDKEEALVVIKEHFHII